MKKSFGNLMYEFALTVDIVDNNTYKSTINCVRNYLKQEFDFEYFNLIVKSKVNGKPGLKSALSDGQGWSTSIVNESKGYNGHVAYSYRKKRPIWVVAENKAPLLSTASYIDLLTRGKKNNLPKYNAAVQDDIRTSVIMPYRFDDEDIAAVVFDSTKYIDFSELLKKELDWISKCTKIFYLLCKSHAIQKDNTKEALGYLEKQPRLKLKEVTKQKVFVAYPNRASRDVVELIMDVLQSYGEVLEVIDWEALDDPGNIPQQIMTMISTSRFGVVYLSEPKDAPAVESNIKFIDNPNVLFEAGMLHALSNDDDAITENWIPIRETQSANVPFDFAANRIVQVNRFKSQAIKNRAQLKSKLKAQIDRIIYL